MKTRGIHWHRRLEVALVLVAGIMYGAWREFMFININYQIDHLARHTPFSYAHSMMQRWTQGMDLSAMVALKWSLGFFSMAVMAGLCMVLARILFNTWQQARWIALGFAGFALLSLGFHLLARWAPPFEEAAVRISHMLQYPVPLLFVLVAGLLPKGQPAPRP